jgi:uncharacterized protein YqjF (DUF2071 family)
MKQRWNDLLFMHWPVSPSDLRSKVPSMLVLDTFENQAWIGITPFRICGLRPRGLPPLPGLSQFAELNVRTYVSLNGKPGVYFFSLDAASRIAVMAARAWYRLPYVYARITIDRKSERFVYRSVRPRGTATEAELSLEYEPNGAVTQSAPGSLAFWLTERYRLYAVRGARVFSADIDHVQWPLQPATAVIHSNTMAASHGIHLPSVPPLLHFSRTLDVRVWRPRRQSSP